MTPKRGTRPGRSSGPSQVALGRLFRWDGLSRPIIVWAVISTLNRPMARPSALELGGDACDGWDGSAWSEGNSVPTASVNRPGNNP